MLITQSMHIKGYTLMAAEQIHDLYGFHHSDPSGSLLKDGGSPTSIPRSQPIMGYTLMAALADPQLIWVFTMMATPWGVP